MTTADLADPAFASRWAALARIGGASPFLSWTWVGCLAAERYREPIVVETMAGEALVGLGLFNRRGDTLSLHETGDAALDAVFMEHNGVVARQDGVFSATLAAVAGLARRVTLSGIGDAELKAVEEAGGIVTGLQTRLAPYTALSGPVVSAMSRNARAQLRRSDRSYADAGPVEVARASDPDEASAWLAALVTFHTATWASRGVVSAFTGEAVQRFVRALVARGMPAGEVDLLRVSAGARPIGYLLNLRANGRVAAFQSGFDYAGRQAHEKPGLTCHHAAMEQARAAGLAEYDFLAGDARYKRSFATGQRRMHWLTWLPQPTLWDWARVRGFAALRRMIRR